MTAPDFREALADAVRSKRPAYGAAEVRWTNEAADAVRALLAEWLGGDEVREVILQSWPGVEPGSYVAARLDAALAALRAHLGVQA